jgi:integrase
VAKELTVPTILKYKPHPTQRREISDSKAKGLRLVIQPKTGRLSWIVRLRRPDGTSAKLHLGPVDASNKDSADAPVAGGALTLWQARQRAAEIDRRRARGIDVVAEEKAAALRKRTDAADAAANTFGAAVKEFFADYQTRKWQARPRHWRNDAATLGLRYPPGSDPATTEPQIIKGGLVEAWGDKPISGIDSYAIHAVVDEARRIGSNSRARKLHSALSVLFSWLQRDKSRHIPINPARGVWRPGPPVARERTLTADEIVAFWKACDNVGGVFGALWKVLLLTGCRLREVSGMTRDELEADGTWTISGSRTKNHRPMSLPLPKLALDVIASVPLIKESPLVFTTNGKTPVSGFSKPKRKLDAEMTKVGGKTIEAFRVHDLRRSFASGLAALGVALPVIERLLNHVSGPSFGGVAGVYQRHEFKDEKRAALARWGSFIEGLVSGRAAKVTPLRKGK